MSYEKFVEINVTYISIALMEQNGETMTLKSTHVRVEIQKLRDIRKMLTKNLPTAKY